MADFINEGKSIPHTASGAVTAGDVILVGEKIAVAKHDIADTEDGVLAAQGVFDFPKTAATVYDIGVKVYWDNLNPVLLDQFSGEASYAIGDDGYLLRQEPPMLCYLRWRLIIGDQYVTFRLSYASFQQRWNQEKTSHCQN